MLTAEELRLRGLQGGGGGRGSERGMATLPPGERACAVSRPWRYKNHPRESHVGVSLELYRTCDAGTLLSPLTLDTHVISSKYVDLF